jgi:hypothetical protein
MPPPCCFLKLKTTYVVRNVIRCYGDMPVVISQIIFGA